MVAIQRATSINLVREELDSTLKQAEAGLEAFADDATNVARIDECIECFHQVWGVLKVLEIPGAADLARELEIVAGHLKQHGVAGNDAAIGALGSGMMILGRYLEYLQLRLRNLPQLLVPAVNALRQSSSRPPVPESAFFACDMHAHRPGEGGDALESDDDIARLARRLRQMYQVALLGVLRGENVAVNLRMMDRALERIDKIGGATPMGRLWWAARGALRALGQPGVEMDRTRKIYLGHLDRQLKRLVQEGGAVLREEPPQFMLRESVYLASLLPAEDSLGAALRKTFRVATDSPDAAELKAEQDALAGPGGSVMRTVAEQVRNDMSAIKDLLDATVQGMREGGYGQVADDLARVSHTLLMLGLVKENQLLKEKVELLRRWQAGVAADPASDEFQRLVDALLSVENSTAILEKNLTPGETPVDAGQSRVAVYQLDDAKRVVMAECRAGIALAKRGVTSYMEANFDRIHLNNIPATLKGVSGGLRFLNLERATGILDACVAYIEGRLLNANLPPPGVNDMETLADAVTGVDYFLESIEEHKPIGEGVLEVAESSMEELGFPVSRRS
jgi:hypothetical protein